jgi:hypothetical protein
LTFDAKRAYTEFLSEFSTYLFLRQESRKKRKFRLLCNIPICQYGHTTTLHITNNISITTAIKSVNGLKAVMKLCGPKKEKAAVGLRQLTA